MNVMPEVMTDSVPAVQNAPAPALIDPAAMAAAEEAKALVQAAYTMALHRPRNYMQARQRILDACKRPSFAATVEYSKPVGKGTVKGPSIRFAELAVQQWGNIRVDTTTTFENDEMRKIRIQVLDLETNACFGRVITINKTIERSDSKGREVLRERTNSYGKPVYILRATEDELAIKEAAAISRVVRNEGLRLIPQDIIDEALETAREARQGVVSDPQERIRKVCDAFAQVRVTPDDLSHYLGCPIDKASPAQIDDLQTVYTAIRSGEAKWVDYVQLNDDKPAAATTETAVKLKEKLQKAKAPHQDVVPSRYPCPRKEGALVEDDDCFHCPERDGCRAR